MKTSPLLSAALASLTALLAAGAAHAHVVLDQPAAPAGSSYRASFRIGHGCDGAATRVVIVTLPEGLRGAKPMPKAGWTLTTTRRPLAAPYESHGKTIADELAEVRWTANTPADQLQDDWFDEFVLRAVLPAEPGELWFSVRQLCTRGEWNWAERPSAETPKPRAPAVKLTVQPAAASDKPHH
ncbi:YcnI family protein [Roseateles sp.]|uniref:YcnI family copper-binding membrane protein n=1 Tax=Roseateles sp. TaxID=1971397 RepID=UPI002E0A25DD|nr:YcnI family protein [Roseateles sp.]